MRKALRGPTFTKDIVAKSLNKELQCDNVLFN